MTIPSTSRLSFLFPPLFPRSPRRLPPGSLTFAALVASGAMLAGCASSPPPPVVAPPGVVGTVQPQEPPPAPSKLSYGTVTSRVKRGETTKAEVLELFGGPNISTSDKEGIETWVYERSSTDSSASSSGSGQANAEAISYFFGGGNVQASGAQQQQGQAHTSARSLTVIVKFDSKDRVVDYAVRASQF